jgi:hypothetical protein
MLSLDSSWTRESGVSRRPYRTPGYRSTRVRRTLAGMELRAAHDRRDDERARAAAPVAPLGFECCRMDGLRDHLAAALPPLISAPGSTGGAADATISVVGCPCASARSPTLSTLLLRRRPPHPATQMVARRVRPADFECADDRGGCKTMRPSRSVTVLRPVDYEPETLEVLFSHLFAARRGLTTELRQRLGLRAASLDR